MTKNYLEINKKLWNGRVEKHFSSEFYDVNSFRSGKTSLNKIELELLENLKGKDLLHVQCHFGQDSISLSRFGAKVTGVDFSEKAIKKAEILAKELKDKSTFVCSNVLEMDKFISKKFDVVFASYGVIGWHPDLNDFVKQISLRLKKGGRFYLIEFHPVLWMFDDDFTRIQYSYFNLGPIIEEFYGSYADKNSKELNKSCCWNHSLGDLFEALSSNEMQISHFKEYNYSPYDIFNNSIEVADGYQIKKMKHNIPYIFSVVATKTV